MRRASGTWLGALCAASLSAVACGGPAPRPSIVLFVIDTLRADRVGAYGHPRPTTPRLDGLAAESVVFEQAYAPAPWTLPSVVSLMTSTFPCEHGVLVDGQQLHPDRRTLAQGLRAAGWHTGSLHANAYAGRSSGLDRGFASSELLPHADGDVVASWLDAAPPGPFFLYVHNVEPHDAYEAPRSLVARFGRVSAGQRKRANALLRHYRQLTRADFDAGLEPGATDNSEAQQAVMARLRELESVLATLYDADVRLADARLGSVIDVLQARGLWEDVLFVVTSDHGEEFGEHGGFQHDQSVYEELVRVPLVVRFPGGRWGGRRVTALASLVDLVPTLAEYLGRPALAEGSRGRSLLPLVRGAGAGADARVSSLRVNRKKHFAPFARERGELNVAVRSGPWKGIWNPEADSFELYDLEADRGEQADLASARPELASALEGRARSWLAACRAGGADAAPVAADPLDDASRERLRALGYVR